MDPSDAGPLRTPHTRVRLPDDPNGIFQPTPLWDVLVFSLLKPDDAFAIIQLAESHAAKHGWTTKRHAHYPTMDIAIDPETTPMLDATIRSFLAPIVLPTLAHHYRFVASELRVQDLFLIKYENQQQQQHGAKGSKAGTAQDRLSAHRDGTLLSFSILLSDPARDFEGGGLCFHSLGPTCEACSGERCSACHGVGRLAIPGCAQGDLTVHCGKLLHEALPVRRGKRYVLVGFVAVTSLQVDHDFVNGLHANTSSALGAWADYEILEECLIQDELE
jgi:predicted 2-oxoglutarate/Fe(II)-dependent dioxygenase YbiX